LRDCGDFTVVRLAPAASRGGLRLPARTYRRRQAVAAGLVVGLVLLAWAALGMLGGGTLPVSERPSSSPAAAPAAAGSRASGAVYVVQPGDTFWSIARRAKPNADPRPLVDRLVAAHGGSTLHVGERIPIPA
jgi:hypothetical protein